MTAPPQVHSVKELHKLIERYRQQNHELLQDNQRLSEQITALQTYQNDQKSELNLSSSTSQQLAVVHRDLTLFRQYVEAVEAADPEMLADTLQAFVKERDTLLEDCDEYRSLFVQLSRQCDDLRKACATLQMRGNDDSIQSN